MKWELVVMAVMIVAFALPIIFMVMWTCAIINKYWSAFPPLSFIESGVVFLTYKMLQLRASDIEVE